MSGDCLECGQKTQWDSELGSHVCTACGTLTNSAQTTLVSHGDSYETSSGHESPFVWDLGNPTLKSIRNKDGRALSGQGKEVRLRQNMFSTYAFITSLCNRLSCPGLASRAQALFGQAMSKGQFRWGRKAKLTAGASVSIAARESRKSVSLRDISVLLDEPLTSLTKTYNEVVKLFGFDLEISDPTVHLTTLHAHLTRVISDSETFELSKTLASVVRSLQPRLSCVIRTAESLAALVTRSGKVSHLATAPTACAIFLLALEGEARSPLPNCGLLAQVLGSRFDVKQGVVMDRYRVIYGIVDEWIKQVPWLQPSTQPRTRASSSRSKVTTRGAVAKGLNDVVQFQEEIWQKSLCGMEKISLNLDPIDEGDGTGDDGMTLAASHEDGDDDDFGSVTSASASVAITTSAMTKRKNAVSSRETSVELTSRPIKKRKTRHDRSVESASQFLLNPTKLKKATDDNQLLSHFLSSDTSSLSHTFVRSPTRLQLLCAVRSGGSDAIADEELFEEGELEDVFRAEEEVNLLVQLVDWDEVLEEKRLNKALRVSGNRSTEPKLEGSQVDPIPPRATGRINMDAFIRMMDPASDLVGCGGVDEEGTVGDSTDGDAEGDCYQWFLDLPTVTLKAGFRFPITVSQKCPHATQGLDAQLEGIEEEEDWRPMSPDHGGTGLGLHDSTDYYDL